MGLTLIQKNTRTSNVPFTDRQVVTLTFGKPVKGLAFTITDLDSYRPSGSNVQYVDNARVTAAVPFTWTHDDTTGAGTMGSGTQADPFRSRVTTPSSSSAVNNDARGGNVRIQFPADEELENLTVEFWNGHSGTIANNGQQAIYLSNFTFTADTLCV